MKNVKSKLTRKDIYERHFKIYPAISTLRKEKGKWKMSLQGYFCEDNETEDINKIVEQIKNTYPEFEIIKILKIYNYCNCLYLDQKKHEVKFFLKEK